MATEWQVMGGLSDACPFAGSWSPPGRGTRSPSGAPHGRRGNSSGAANHPFGDVSEAVGVKERPICIPAYSN